MVPKTLLTRGKLNPIKLMKAKFHRFFIALALLALATLNTQLSTVFAQGTLTPPGAPAPTMKSLDQIQARTPISSLPFTITNSGAYYLTGSLSFASNANAITILANETIDLNGFTLFGPVGPGGVGGGSIAIAPDGLPVAWLLQNFGTTNVNASADPTGKGMTIGQDYLAGTDPNSFTSLLKITAESFASGGTSASLTWNSVPTRFYYVQKTTGLSSPVWTDSGLGLVTPAAGSTTTAGFTDTNAPARFYRVQAVRPLMP